MNRLYYYTCFWLMSSVGYFFAAVPGTLDTTFNSGGALPGTQRTTIDTATEAFGFLSALQSDGKIISVGVVVEGGLNRFAVARFNTDGLLDPTFNPGGSLPGTVSTAIDDNANSAFGDAVAIQTDGKIVVAGTVTEGGLGKFAIARFNSDGSLDTTFNATGSLPGTVSTAIDNTITADAACDGVALQPDGKIVLVGSVIEGALNIAAMARFNSDGTLDTTFNPGGTIPGTLSANVDNPANSSFFDTASIQFDGKIVVGGNVTDSISGLNRFAVARFNNDGSLDTTFNNAGTLPGTVSTAIDNVANDSSGISAALQINNKIIVTGSVVEGGISKFGVARFNVDGTLDTTFNNAGTLPGTTSTFVDSIGQDTRYGVVALQKNGQIVVAGYLVNGVNIVDKFAVARFNPDGLLDTTFNPGGGIQGTASTVFDPPSTFVPASGVAIQSDNKIVLTGAIDESADVSKFALARFNGDLSIIDVCAP